MIEWRVRNVQLAKSYRSKTEIPFVPSSEAIKIINRKMKIYRNAAKDIRDGRRQEEDQTALLKDICAQAFRIALLFRGTKTEYVWSQKGAMAVDESEVEVLGTNGYPSLNCPESKIVFGAVIKGVGSSGRISEESYCLRKREIILGPFDSPRNAAATTTIASNRRVPLHSR